MMVHVNKDKKILTAEDVEKINKLFVSAGYQEPKSKTHIFKMITGNNRKIQDNIEKRK